MLLVPLILSTVLSKGATFDPTSAPTAGGLTADSNGTMRYCSDCTIANPCAGGGTGAFAKRINGAWICN